MFRKLLPWIAGGMAMGLVVITFFWCFFSFYVKPYLTGDRAHVDEAIVASLVENNINNPYVQNALRNQAAVYLKSPEGRKKMVETLKSPEMLNAMADNIQSPEMKAAVLKLVETPEFRKAVSEAMKDTPEMRILTLLSKAVVIEDPKNHPAAAGADGK